jgi:hypothetical protein
MPDLEELKHQELPDGTKESIERAHDLVDAMKIVQEYENTILFEDDEPPLFQPGTDAGEARSSR